MTKKYTTILAIETSCDETSLALVRATGGIAKPAFKLIKHLVLSQIPLHQPYGGVVPNIAKREHIAALPVLWEQLLGKNKKTAATLKKSIDYVTVTVGPGLEPALWAGIVFAQKLGEELGVPVTGTSHMEGHLYSFLLSKSRSAIQFPMIGLVVSGGHTMLVHMKSLTDISVIGQTRDDAVGEAYDKVARMVQLPYPGGPEVEKLAKKGKKDAIAFPRPMLAFKNYDFSFSGLKTSVLYYLRDNPNADLADVAASFQEAAVAVLAGKTARAIAEYGVRSISLSGGVAGNKYLRTRMKQVAKDAGIPLFVPSMSFNTDNAAMIAAASYINFLQKKSHPLSADGNLLF